MKSGKRLVWSKGVPEISNHPIPSLSPSPSPSPILNSTPTLPNQTNFQESRYLVEKSLNLNLCKIPDFTNDGRKAYTSVGFPMVKERLRTSGNIQAYFVAVDFSDYPSSESFAIQLDPFANSAKQFFEYISGDRIKWTNILYPGIIRLDNPSTSYKITRNDKLDVDFRPIRSEIISKIENSGVDLSRYDLVAFVPPRNSKFDGPAFPEKSDTAIRGKYGPILNSVFFAWFYPPSYMVAHEIGHLFGFNHVDDLRIRAASGTIKYPLSTSGWDVMAADSSVMSYFGWHKWLLGWIEDQQVTCLDNSLESEVILKLNSIDGNSEGRKLLVIKVSNSQVILIEKRTMNSFDIPMLSKTSVVRSVSDFGIIAYLLDTTKGWEQGSIQVLGDGPTNRWQQKIGIGAGQEISFYGFKLAILESEKDFDWIKLTKNEK